MKQSYFVSLLLIFISSPFNGVYASDDGTNQKNFETEVEYEATCEADSTYLVIEIPLTKRMLPEGSTLEFKRIVGFEEIAFLEPHAEFTNETSFALSYVTPSGWVKGSQPALVHNFFNSVCLKAQKFLFQFSNRTESLSPARIQFLLNPANHDK